MSRACHGDVRPGGRVAHMLGLQTLRQTHVELLMVLRCVNAYQ